MKKVINNIALVVVLATGLVACSGESDKLRLRPDYSKPSKKEDLGEYVPFNPYVDILFVIDNSGSMQSHQDNLVDNIEYFIDGITSNKLLEFNIGVITSDQAELRGNHYNVVTKNTPNMKNILRDNLLAGTNGDPTEVFFDNISRALSPQYLNGVNQGFYRKDALLAIVLLTDTEDQGRMSARQLWNDLVILKNGDASRVAVYSVIIPHGEYRCPRDDGDQSELMDFTNLANGMMFNLCDPDYGKKLLAIGDDITEKSALTIPLKQIPAVNTIKVTYGTQTIPNNSQFGWVYDPKKNAILLGKDMKLNPEPNGTKMEVTFVPADLVVN